MTNKTYKTNTTYRTFLAFFACALFFFSAPSVSAASVWYVSSTGSPSGNGSINSPWDLQTALNHPAAVKPGDTIYLRGGVYTAAPTLGVTYQYIFRSFLDGSTGAGTGNHITVRSYPGERATLDAGVKSVPGVGVTILVVTGPWTIFRDLEITNSQYDPTTVIYNVQSIGAFQAHAREVKLIHNVIHNISGEAIGTSAAAWVNGEVYGNLIYNIGGFNDELVNNQLKRVYTGHAMYLQNPLGSRKIVKHNIVFQTFGLGIGPHGNQGAVDDLTIVENAVFNTGSVIMDPPGDPSFEGRNFQIYRFDPNNSPVKNLQLLNNWSYYSDTGPRVELSNSKGAFFIKSPEDSTISGNYFMRGQIYQNGTKTNTTFANNVIWPDPNAYFGFTPQTTNPTNTWLTTKPSTNMIFVKPDDYDSSRALVVIYNWQNQNTVTIDISSLGWANGATYRLRNVQNYFSDITTGSYGGNGSVSVPMTGHSVAKPLNWSVTPVSTFPEFGVFVLEKTGSGGSPPPAPPPPPSPPIGGPDITAPIISNIQISNVNETGATVSWTTDEPADSQIDYGITTGYGSQTTLNSSLTTNHAQTISGLTSGTLYNYRVRSSDAAGNLATSGNSTFITAPIASSLSPGPISSPLPLPSPIPPPEETTPTPSIGIGQDETNLTIEEMKSLLASLLQQLADLQAKLATLQGGTPPTGTPILPAAGRALSLGSRGTDVMSLQTFLIERGYLAPNNASGYFGPLTKQAVQKYQCVHQIVCGGNESTTGFGLVGKKTRAVMGR